MKDQEIEPIWDTVSRVYERYLALTFDEMLTEEDRLFLWAMEVENGAAS